MSMVKLGKRDREGPRAIPFICHFRAKVIVSFSSAFPVHRSFLRSFVGRRRRPPTHNQRTGGSQGGYSQSHIERETGQEARHGDQVRWWLGWRSEIEQGRSDQQIPSFPPGVSHRSILPFYPSSLPPSIGMTGLLLLSR